MSEKTYECVGIFDDPGGPYVVAFKGGGDYVRVECPPHHFFEFEIGEKYFLSIEKIPPEH